MVSREGTRPVRRTWWPWAGAALLAFTMATYSRADADLWGHLRYGLDALDTGELTSVDPYSFTQDTPWVNHEWLSEVQTALAYRLGGIAGLALLKGALVFATFWLMWVALDGTRLGIRLLVMAFAAFGTVHITSAIRPQAWTFLALALLCHALAAGRGPWLRWLPGLFVIWVNVHGGWVVGLGVLAAWAAGDVLTNRASLRTWAWVVPLCVAATLTNPYGWGIWDFVLRTVRPERQIAEWQPAWKAGWGIWLPWCVATVCSLWALLRLPDFRWSTALVVLMLAWSSLQVMRIGSLFIEAAVILLAPAVVASWPARYREPPGVRPRGEGLVAGYVFALALAASVFMGRQTMTCLPIIGDWAPDLEPVHRLHQAPPGRLVTFFNWGQYALWHLGPETKVSMDGRRETVYSDARLAEHDAIILGTDEGLQTLARWQAEYVWLPSTSGATRDWLQGNSYRIDFESPRSFVAVREDLPRLPEWSGAAIPACFPG